MGEGTGPDNWQEKNIEIRLMNYHYLDGLADESFDGVYTLETIVHATDPERALKEFSRVLRPGGSLALTNMIIQTLILKIIRPALPSI